MKCPAGFNYSSSAKACQATCENRAFIIQCDLPNRPSCICPEDHVELGNKCVLREDCQCIDSSFELHNVSITDVMVNMFNLVSLCT